AIVVPRRYAVYDCQGLGSTKKSIRELYECQQVIDIDLLKPPHVPQSLQITQADSEIMPGCICLPYLEHIDLERYVDVVQNNRDLFTKVSSEFRNAIEDKHGGGFIPAWVQAYNNTVVDIQIAYEKASNELMKKGISVVVG